MTKPVAGCWRFTCRQVGAGWRASRCRRPRHGAASPAGCARVGQVRRADGRAHAAGAQELLQLAVERIDDENFGRAVTICDRYRTNRLSA